MLNQTTNGRQRGAESRRSRVPSAYPWWFIAPAMVLFGLFFVLPNLLNFVFPFTNWSAFRPDIKFIGLTNFRNILADGSLLSALRVSVLFAILTTLFSNTLGMALALLLERDTTLNRIVRAIFILPVLVSSLAIGYIFQAMLLSQGALNQLLGWFAGGRVSIPWLGSPDWTLVVVAAVNSWHWVGLTMLIYLAGLKTIPADLIEAGRVDGAGGWRMFRSIRFPLLAPATTFNVATGLLGGLSAFDVILATTQGGPAQTTQTFNVYMFTIFGRGLYGQASAVSLILFIVVVLVAIPLVAYLRRREQEL